MTRNVLLLQTPASTVELAALLEPTWNVERIPTLAALAAALGTHRCHVGIVVLDESLGCAAGEVTDLAAEHPIEWVAVVPRARLQEAGTTRALALKFFDYHTMPIDPSRLLYCLGHAHGKAVLRRQSGAVPPPTSAGRFGMIGRSAAMLALYADLEKVTRVSAPVLIGGESGVGKELAALAVHRESTRRKGPFVPVNCGAISASLLETTLFGHEKGAFTGAYEKHVGSLEAADGGCLFLDEIGDLPLTAQASLLRFLQESTVVRVGSTRTIRLDVRVIAASHVDLHAAVCEGRFREDLYYRLNVLRVEVPPLRERGADVAMLARHFFATHRALMAPGVHGFADDALGALQRHRWPGNVRELFNRLQRAMVMCDGAQISAADLQLDARASSASLVSLANARSGMERGIVEAALLRNGFNIAATARDLAVSRVTLYRMMRKFGLGARRGKKDGAPAMLPARRLD